MEAMLIRLGSLLECMHRLQWLPTTNHSWNQLPTKGDLSGSLASIRQAPDELFSGFCG